MSCLICLEDLISKDTTKAKNCNCNINYHKDCYQDFLKNSMFSCPICRIKDNNISRTQNDEFSLFETVFKLPTVLALPLWFAISWIFTIFVMPVMMLHVYFEKNIPNTIVLSSCYFCSIYLLIKHMINI